MYLCVPVYVCVCYRAATAPAGSTGKGLKDGGGEEGGACFVLSVGGERLFSGVIKPLRTKKLATGKLQD